MKKILKTIFITIGILVVLAIAFIGIEIFISYKLLSVTNYTVKSDKIKKETKVIMVSDLHDATFGRNNSRLVKKIKAQNPDVILMAGDLINDSDSNCDVATNLIKQLKELAPVYVSWGNQELDCKNMKISEIKKAYEGAGAKVLDKEYKDINVNGNKLRIGGVYDYCFSQNSLDYIKEGDLEDSLYKYLKDFQDTDAYNIMMAHRPDSFVFGAANFTWHIDMVFSGHIHGGQVRIPGKGGLYGADLGWFPKYAEGLFHFKTVKNMVVTRGLGSDKEKLPRFNNVPEIVSITLKG